jgi:CBS domain-containing protein
MKVGNILDHKGSKVVTMPPEAHVSIAAQRLRLEQIGAILILAEAGRIAGILSERDVVHGLAEHGPGVVDMPVSAIMTTNVRTCRTGDDVRDVMRLMTVHRIRHVPVVDDGQLRGLVSIGDVVKNRLDEMELEANVLRDYAVAHH